MSYGFGEEFTPEDCAFLSDLDHSMDNGFDVVEGAETALRALDCINAQLDYEVELAAMRIAEVPDPALAEVADTINRAATSAGRLVLDDTELRYLGNLDNPLPRHHQWSGKNKQAALEAARRLIEENGGD